VKECNNTHSKKIVIYSTHEKRINIPFSYYRWEKHRDCRRGKKIAIHAKDPDCVLSWEGHNKIVFSCVSGLFVCDPHVDVAFDIGLLRHVGVAHL